MQVYTDDNGNSCTDINWDRVDEILDEADFNRPDSVVRTRVVVLAYFLTDYRYLHLQEGEVQRRTIVKSLLAPAVDALTGFRLPLANAADYDGKLFVFVQADGGWDPTSFCDPKANTPGEKVINHWAENGEIRQAKISSTRISATWSNGKRPKTGATTAHCGVKRSSPSWLSRPGALSVRISGWEVSTPAPGTIRITIGCWRT